MEKSKIYREILLANGYIKLDGGLYEKYGFEVSESALNKLSPKEFADRLANVEERIKGRINIVLEVNRILEAGIVAVAEIFKPTNLEFVDTKGAHFLKFKEALNLCNKK